MFEKYTEKARRAVFFSRWEAGEYGATTIDTEYLLLGLLREDGELIEQFSSTELIGLIRKHIERNIIRGTIIQGSVDIPLSDGYQAVLLRAADEANQLNSKYIDTKHLLLGILREEKSLAADILLERGIEYSTFRTGILKRKSGDLH